MSPGRLDPIVVRRHLAALERGLVELRRHAGRPVEALRDDLGETWLVQHGLQLCAQNVLDLATHIAAAKGLDASDYATAIDRLAELGAIPRDLARSLRAIAGFRNVLVHAYLDVDLTIVHAVLNERLDELALFARAIGDYLDGGA